MDNMKNVEVIVSIQHTENTFGVYLPSFLICIDGSWLRIKD